MKARDIFGNDIDGISLRLVRQYDIVNSKPIPPEMVAKGPTYIVRSDDAVEKELKARARLPVN